MIELGKLQGKNATMAYCFALGGNGKAFSRGMLPWELYEDAATGSAAGSLGAYLVRREIGRAQSELQSRQYLVCRLLLEKKKKRIHTQQHMNQKNALNLDIVEACTRR